MKNAISLWTLIALVAPTQAVAEKNRPEPLVLKPTSKWVADYQEDGCRLIRRFGSGDQEVTLLIERFQPVQYFGLRLGGKPLAAKDKLKPGKLRYGSNEAVQDVDYYTGEMGPGVPALVFGRSAIAELPETVVDKISRDGASDQLPEPPAPSQFIAKERYAAADHIWLDASIERPVQLQTGALDKPFAALDVCIDDLVKSWGLDPVQQRTLSRYVSPKMSPSRWITSQEYPRDMLEQKQSALVHFRMMVGADGRPTSCVIQQSTRPKEFDDAVCDNLTRAGRFHPALDATGQPVASYYANTVDFRVYQ